MILKEVLQLRLALTIQSHQEMFLIILKRGQLHQTLQELQQTHLLLKLDQPLPHQFQRQEYPQFQIIMTDTLAPITLGL